MTFNKERRGPLLTRLQQAFVREYCRIRADAKFVNFGEVSIAKARMVLAHTFRHQRVNRFADQIRR